VNAVATAVAVLLLALAASEGRTHVLIGRSVEGRGINAVELGNPRSANKLLVVGCIHGIECAGLAIVRALERLPTPPSLDLWVIDNLNPDGYTSGTRQNAHGVDLNRNFPWNWRPLSGVYNSGPGPLSEPESRVAFSLILRVRPRISIWFHQHERVVDESGGDIAIERRFSTLVGLPLRRLPREPGSAVGWENHRFPGTTAFVVELPSGSLSSAAADRYARAVLTLPGRR
jgi:murein peptide amidase A